MLLTALPAGAAEAPLPALRDGITIKGPGRFRHDGQLTIQGTVRLQQLTLDLHGPIRLEAGSTLQLEDVHLIVSDPLGAPNGTSGLRCVGPAKVVIRDSTMAPSGTAHPMWQLQGDLDVENFRTQNSEFHLEHVRARLDHLTIFELEISHDSDVVAHHLTLVFLSTHSGDDDRLSFSDIPADRPFSKTLALGSGAKATLHDVRLQFFLLYVHGQSQATLERMGRVQLAIFPRCSGRMQLPRGYVGSTMKPAIFPEPSFTDCAFRLSLNDVNVDTWDVYSGGAADLTFTNSRIDELTAGDHARVTVRDSMVYADWLAASGDARLDVADSTVGALSLAAQRPDLATSQIRLTGSSQSVFSRVRFDCGIFAGDQAHADIRGSIVPPKYIRRGGAAMVQVENGTTTRKVEGQP